MIRPTLVTAPVGPIVSLDDLKAHCRVDFTDDDDLLEALAAAAVAHLDGYTGVLGRCMETQTWRHDFECWPRLGCLRLPFPDTSSVTVSYFDAENVEQTVSSALYGLVETSLGSVVRFSDSFTRPTVYSDRVDGVRVAQTCGFGAVADVPGPLKTAIKMMVAHWYENREGVVVGTGAEEFPMGVAMLIAPYRRAGV